MLRFAFAFLAACAAGQPSATCDLDLAMVSASVFTVTTSVDCPAGAAPMYLALWVDPIGVIDELRFEVPCGERRTFAELYGSSRDATVQATAMAEDDDMECRGELFVPAQHAFDVVQLHLLGGGVVAVDPSTGDLLSL